MVIAFAHLTRVRYILIERGEDPEGPIKYPHKVSPVLFGPEMGDKMVQASLVSITGQLRAEQRTAETHSKKKKVVPSSCFGASACH